MSASTSMSTPSIVAAGGHVRFLHNFLQGKRLVWRVWSCFPHQISARLTGHSTPRNILMNMQEEEETVRSDSMISIYWRATAIVDGESIGWGSGPRLKVAKDRAARDALIALGQIEASH
ncbi:hypothetical protein BS47DRAFT_1158598 [Hydnum rufescens UP504]|uniref:DRBM domain-containing protein n=1 Tax=Hydnum rufescens UP504 TaxID=1448309 RepID=A0A9P6DVD8_9AGAM|nr:hypothetical protein BS47DRAFT_1158598 [Hydnum rufescens UP504]